MAVQTEFTVSTGASSVLWSRQPIGHSWKEIVGCGGFSRPYCFYCLSPTPATP
jgi:hypothetical protein